MSKTMTCGADAIRSVAKTIGYYNRNEVIIDAVERIHGLKVSQVQVIQAIGCAKNRQSLPSDIFRLARLFLQACNGDHRLASGVLRQQSLQ